NYDRLPDYAQAELDEVWRTWLPGTPCTKELEIQQDIFNLVKAFSNKVERKKESENSSRRRYIVPAATTPFDYDDDYVVQSSASFPNLIGAAADTNRRAQSKSARLYEVSMDDIATMRFNDGKASFLRSVSPEVRRQFEDVWNDEDIPSESLRMFKIQLLAVSLLTAKQLEEYNRWATRRRYVLKARERELSRLSTDARRILKRMSSRHHFSSCVFHVSSTDRIEQTEFVKQMVCQFMSLRLTSDGEDEELIVSPLVKQELRKFLIAFNRRRSRAFD
ncbi:hypothetical protein KIN20_006199, partial [Parelaphostrongylus tenuis]